MVNSPLDLSIVVPLFNEAESLEELARLIEQVCMQAGYRYEVWLIDDGSTDGSWEVIRRIHERNPAFKGVRFRRNYGKSAALAAGFARAQGRYVVTMDADLQDDPTEIPALIEILEQGYDLVSGWKQRRQDPLSKTIPSRLFNWVTRIVSGIPLHDFNCGLKAYRLEVVQQIRVYGEMHRYIPVLARWEGFDRITEKPVRHHPRRYGRTKFGVSRFLHGFLDLIAVTFLTRYVRRPMHFFGALGTAFILLGLLINAYLTLEWLQGRPLSNRPLLFLGILLLILGVQFFATGLLGEMIIRPEMERGAYQVREELR
jgi:glycosyltransferase involved in cell wall biosynthesis|nr:MAG: glycosyl transferase family 2 [Bacteroidota bacterium]